jgi:hypothetical protein
MKNGLNKLYFYSLTSLTSLAATAAYAEQLVTAPTLEGGVNISIGTFYAAPGSDGYNYADKIIMDSTYPTGLTRTPLYNDSDYDFGFEASLGYVFEDTANGIELSYRGLHSSTDDSITTGDGEFIAIPGGTPDGIPSGTDTFNTADNSLTYNFNTVDLMISQFLDIGRHVQMRLQGGLAYANIEQKAHTTFSIDGSADTAYPQKTKSEFNGWGPRLGTDARYEFGNGIGILGGVSLAYLIGDLNGYNKLSSPNEGELEVWDFQDDISNHSVVNLRGNLGVDYVYFFEEQEGAAMGLEVGYLADYYTEAVNEVTGGNSGLIYGPTTEMQSASFSGPYVNLKGVF